jgi:hypothetical protein
MNKFMGEAGFIADKPFPVVRKNSSPVVFHAISFT